MTATTNTDRVRVLAAPVSVSEDFGSFGTEWGVPGVQAITTAALDTLMGRP